MAHGYLRGGGLEDVIDELIAYAPEAKVIAFVTESERPSGLRVLVHANAPYSAAELTRQFGATGTRERASFTLKEELPLIEGMKTVIDRLKEQLAKTAKN
jgi:hypothetical protein